MASVLEVQAAGAASQQNEESQNGLKLERLLQDTPQCLLKPFKFFVSWQGVLTLAFSGFPPALVQLKEDIGRSFPSLPKENPGSLWPKCSLGALRDNKRLDPSQLGLLNSICEEASKYFREVMDKVSESGILLDHACVLLYECRSLEKLISKQKVPFTTSTSTDTRSPTTEEEFRVARIVGEAHDPDYWFAASRDGNRESHYRGTALGATLAFSFQDAAAWRGDANVELQYQTVSRLLMSAISAFRESVEQQLPGMYAFFNDESLHITLRAIMG